MKNYILTFSFFLFSFSNLFCQDSISNMNRQKWLDYINESNKLHDSLINRKYYNYSFIDNNNKIQSNINNDTNVVMFVFWFLGCSGCLKEIKFLNLINDKFKNECNFKLIALSFDMKDSIIKNLNRLNIKYPTASIKREEIEKLKIDGGYPSYVIIKKGNIIDAIHTGSISDKYSNGGKSVDFIIKEIESNLK